MNPKDDLENKLVLAIVKQYDGKNIMTTLSYSTRQRPVNIGCIRLPNVNSNRYLLAYFNKIK